MPQPPPIVLDPTGAHPDTEATQLRAHGPAVRVDILGVTAWAVTDPTVLKNILTSPDVSKDARQHWPRYGQVVTTWPLVVWIAVENMFTAYGGDHGRLRRMVAPAFSARRITALTGAVRAIVDDLLDGLATSAPGEITDLRETYAYPVPIRVISHLLGLPDSQRDAFRSSVDGVFDTTLTREQAAANTSALYGILDQLIATRRADPGDDLTTHLITVRDGDGSALSEGELRDTLLLMVSAGYETTVNLIDQAITLLLSHPRHLADVFAGRTGWPDVVEETLRLEPPVKHLPLRYALADITLPDGQVIAGGEAILASYAAANRHPDWHDRADTFDPTRTTPGPEHLAFGHGVHYCLGAPLARLEAVVALEALFTRFPHTELAVPSEQLPRVPSLIANGHRYLPLRLTPAAMPPHP